MIILLILVLALRVSFLIVLLNMNSSAITTIVWSTMITLATLSGEALVYRILRARFHRMLWVWTHIILLYVVLLIMPLFYLLGSMILPRLLNLDTYADWVAKLGLVQVVMFWSGIGIGHFFFVLTIVYGFRKKKVTEPVQYGPSHLLDEFNE